MNDTGSKKSEIVNDSIPKMLSSTETMSRHMDILLRHGVDWLRERGLPFLFFMMYPHDEQSSLK